MTDLICPDCGSPMILRTTTKFPNKDGSPSFFYGCTTFPTCRATHGAHPDGRPLGIPADKETKAARIRAHERFDRLWKGGSKVMSRKAAYAELAKVMEMTTEDCHMGRFSIEDCELVVSWVEGLEIHSS